MLAGLLQPALADSLVRKCVLDPAAESISLAACAARLVDEGGDLGIHDVADARNAARFETLNGFLSGGYTRAANWYRLTIERPHGAPADWVLAMGAPFLDDVRVYVPRVDGEFLEIRLGDHVPRDKVPLSSRLHSVQVSVPAGLPMDLYVRIASRSALVFSARMWQPTAFVDAERQTTVIHSVYFGILATIVIFYLVWGFALREKSLVFYALTVACIFLFYFSVNGFVAMLLAPQRPWLQDSTTEIGVLSVNIALTLMWNSFVGFRKNFPRFWYLFPFTLVVNTVCLLAIGSAYYGLAAQVSNYLTFAFSAVSLGLLIALLRRRWDRVVFVYILAFAPPMAAAVVQIGVTQGFVVRNVFTTNIYQVASICHIVLLGLAFVLRVLRIQEERRHAQQEALVSSRLADEQRKVVAMLSHEFRSPLAAIDRAAEMVEIGCPDLDDAARERIHRIRTHTGQMAGLVDVFLTSEALEHGRMALHAEPTAVSEIVFGLRQRFQDEVARGRLVVRDEAGQLCPEVDAELLGVALGNILENAFRYSPPDTAVVLRTLMKGDAMMFEVSDCGAGMLPEEVEKLGALYFRGKSSAGTNGSGLGLYITRRIVDAHGGRLLVASSPHEGTTITVSLPFSLVRSK